MLRYDQFLTERFLDTRRTSEGFVEVFIDPTWDEWSDLMGARNEKHNYHSSELGVWLSPAHVYAWNRDFGSHGDVLRLIASKGKDKESSMLPLYFFPHGRKRFGLGLGEWSFTPDMNRLYYASGTSSFDWDRLLSVLRKHPALSGYSFSV